MIVLSYRNRLVSIRKCNCFYYQSQFYGFFRRFPNYLWSAIRKLIVFYIHYQLFLYILSCDKINQAVPLFFIKLRCHAILPLQFHKEPFYLFLLQLLLNNGVVALIQPCLRLIIPSYLTWYSVWSKVTWLSSSRTDVSTPPPHSVLPEAVTAWLPIPPYRKATL